MFEIVEVALHTASIPRADKFAVLPGPVRGVRSSPGTGVDDGPGVDSRGNVRRPISAIATAQT